jgi:hypothetical protein
MPILHQYQDKSGYYARTVIQNNIITFQLTSAGARRLLEAGIKAGAKFRRALLFGIYRSGDAFTHGTGPGVIEPSGVEQMELDFASDPEPQTIFPRCSSCSSLNVLYLVEIQGDQRHALGLFCPLCREKSRSIIDMSIPLPFVTRAIFERLLQMKAVLELDTDAAAFKGHLDRAFQEKWNELLERKIRARDPKQEALFDTEKKQRKLI